MPSPLPHHNVTKERKVRVTDDAWEDFMDDAHRAGSNASRVLNAFIAWYTRVPGADLPDRPPPLET